MLHRLPLLSRIPRLCAAAVLFSATACMFLPGNDSLSQGGGSDTETLTGAVSLENGSPAARTLVKLVPPDYDPSHPDTALIRKTMTDAAGNFRFEKLADGKYYNLIAGKPDERAWAFAESLKTGSGRRPLSLSMAKVFLITLEYPGYEGQDSGVAYFPGTDILARCSSLSVSRVDSIPKGVSRIVVESRAGWKRDTTFADVKDTSAVQATKDGIIFSQ
jgi:hypothetical protein